MGKQFKKRTPLSRLGEFGLIDHITGWVKLSQPSSLKGAGDDAAVLEYCGGQLVLTTDLLLEGIHFNLVYTPLRHLGYKSIVVNLSDVYAMNATPRQVTVSLGLSAKLFLEDIEELYQGIRLACERYGVDLVGGDISASMTGLLISVTAVGEAGPGKVVYRSGAKNGDLICVTGDLGAAYLGLQVLERENRIFRSDESVQPLLEGYDYILERQLKPEARREVIEYFHRDGIR